MFEKLSDPDVHTIVFDTETTGLLVPDSNSLDDQPEIVEIHCTKIDQDFNLIDEFSQLIKPRIPITEKLTSIHGISNEMVEGAGSFADHYEGLAEFFTGVHKLVAHNLSYDRDMLANELLRIDKVLNFPWPPIHICTVEKSMGIEQRRISLSNLHKYATGNKFEGAHRAKADVHALVRCYFYLSEKGLA